MPVALKPGDAAPPFAVPDQDGRPATLAEHRGRWLVLWFYPKDETPGCVREACRFRDETAAFDARGIVVLGVSRDTVASHRAFADARRLKYRLLADEDGAMSRAYGAVGFLGIAKRVSYLVDPEGVVRAAYDSHLRPENHAAEMLAAHDALAPRAR